MDRNLTEFRKSRHLLANVRFCAYIFQQALIEGRGSHRQICLLDLKNGKIIFIQISKSVGFFRENKTYQVSLKARHLGTFHLQVGGLEL